MERLQMWRGWRWGNRYEGWARLCPLQCGLVWSGPDGLAGFCQREREVLVRQLQSLRLSLVFVGVRHYVGIPVYYTRTRACYDLPM